MVRLAQLVRASDCGSEGQGFETLISPQKRYPVKPGIAFFGICVWCGVVLLFTKRDAGVPNVNSKGGGKAAQSAF